MAASVMFACGTKFAPTKSYKPSMHADAGGEPALVANYRFEEGAGTTVSNQGSAGSTANLSLGNANHFNWTTTDLINFSDVLTADTTDLEDTGISASYDSANGRLTLTSRRRQR